MTDRPCRDLLFICMRCLLYNLITAVLITTPEAALSLVQVIYVMASYRTYGGSKLINEAILYFCELTISCKYESIPYLLYTRKPDMGEYTH